MNIRFKPNNVIALLIAVILILTGVMLGIINNQSSNDKQGDIELTKELAVPPKGNDSLPVNLPSENPDTLVTISRIHAFSFAMPSPFPGGICLWFRWE